MMLRRRKHLTTALDAPVSGIQLTSLPDLEGLHALIWGVETLDFGGYSSRDALSVAHAILRSDWFVAALDQARQDTLASVYQALESAAAAGEETQAAVQQAWQAAIAIAAADLRPVNRPDPAAASTA